MYGGADNDNLSGDAGNDLLDGGIGNDTLTGGVGNDTYVFRVGSGQDVVSNYDTAIGRVDSIRFEDVTSTDLRGLRRVGIDLILDYGTTDQVTIQNHYAGAAYQLNQFTFSDGVTLTPVQLLAAYRINLTDGADSQTFTDAAETIYAGLGNDTISGGAGDDRLYGQAGNDYLSGGTGDDSLYGGADNDNLSGDAGNDLLDGGIGNETLSGDAGNDTYLFRSADGQDVINDYSTTTTEVDTLKLTDGITSTEPVIVKQNGDLYVFVNGTNYVKIASQFSATTYGIERLEVSDGHYVTRADIETIVNTMSTINNNSGMDVMQKYNAMMADQSYISTLAQTWRQM